MSKTLINDCKNVKYPLLFKQYMAYIESAEKISSLRSSANNYLLAINSVIIGLYGFFTDKEKPSLGLLLLFFAGILVCYMWRRIVSSYRDINTVKFKVIHELEQHMPAQIYAYEWREAEEGKGKSYAPISHLENLQ